MCFCFVIMSWLVVRPYGHAANSPASASARPLARLSLRSGRCDGAALASAVLMPPRCPSCMRRWRGMVPSDAMALTAAAARSNSSCRWRRSCSHATAAARTGRPAAAMGTAALAGSGRSGAVARPWRWASEGAGRAEATGARTAAAAAGGRS